MQLLGLAVLKLDPTRRQVNGLEGVDDDSDPSGWNVANAGSDRMLPPRRLVPVVSDEFLSGLESVFGRLEQREFFAVGNVTVLRHQFIPFHDGDVPDQLVLSSLLPV